MAYYLNYNLLEASSSKRLWAVSTIVPFLASVRFIIMEIGGAIPAGIYLFNSLNGNTRTMCEICSKLTIKKPEQRHWRCSNVFIVNLEQILNVVVFLLSTLKKEMPAGVTRNGVKMCFSFIGAISEIINIWRCKFEAWGERY